MTLSTTDSLAVYLASLSAPDLARIVTMTPTVPEEPRPTTLRHVAVCLADPETALLGCSFLSRGELQLLEVLWAVAEERPPGGAARLGGDAGPRLDDDPVVVVDPEALIGLVCGPDRSEARDLGPALDALTGRVLAWPEDGRIRLHPGAASVFPLPLGLGAPAYGLLLGQRPEDLQAIVRELGGLPAGRKDENAVLAARLLGDPEVVRRIAARLDPSARAALDELAEVGIRRDPTAAWGYFGPTTRRAGAADGRSDGFARLRRRGLLLPTGDGWEMMPREVALALRGDDYRVPFESRPPRVATEDADRAAVLRSSAASASAALDVAARLLHACAVGPPVLLKSGGVGVREMRRLARELGCDEGTVRLWLHVAESAGLVVADAERGRVLPTSAYDAWLDGEPAARLMVLVRGWVTMPDVPTLDVLDAAARPGARPPAPLSGASARGGLALVARGTLLRTLGAMGLDRAVADPASLARCVAWVCPTPFRQGIDEMVAGFEVGGGGVVVGDAAGDGGAEHGVKAGVDAGVELGVELEGVGGEFEVDVNGGFDRGFGGPFGGGCDHDTLVDAVGDSAADLVVDANCLVASDAGTVRPAEFPLSTPCGCADCRDVADELETAYRGRFDAVAFTVTALHEAAALGLVAHGALTALGGGLAVQHSAAALLAVAEELVPPATRRARFRADLTAAVAGTPAVELVRLLGRCAEVESPGRVWRFSEISVRRHLDAGGTAAGLLADLAEAAIGELPKPLEDLIHDVGRRYGQVRVAPAAGVVYSDDETLVTELLHHRGLSDLRLRRIAPTVLLCAEPLDEAVRRLRKAGYAPAAESETGSALVERPAEFRAEGADPDPGRGGRTVVLTMADDAAEDRRCWAADLLDKALRPPPPLTAKAARLHEAAPLLGPEDCLVLAQALDRGSAVRVAATAYNGEPMTSTVAHLAMAGDSLYMRPPNGRPALLPFRLETLWLVLPAED
ncbi:helicase-associated domain-containing protein [Yinghuangia sp. YIM S09857]|uniref:helicase-associated domain-containing protein n=1 Tax=Yinghuangia sp. YIM S09857 TaxID=3436929 RepID=UPI003F53C983